MVGFIPAAGRLSARNGRSTRRASSGLKGAVAELGIDTRIGSCEFAGVFFNHVPFPSSFRQSVYIACEQGTCNRKQAKAYYPLISGTTKAGKSTERTNPWFENACEGAGGKPAAGTRQARRRRADNSDRLAKKIAKPSENRTFFQNRKNCL